ncbi:uncharacterized protein TNCV_1632491 [Trichonephila clavipes]|nr:uncharacterized protein TNCV_1632491 [Trichonephila clavipes]
MENFTNEFLKKFERNCFLEPSQDNTRALEWLLKKPDLVLSGCKVINYRRSSVLTAVGTIITYGLLVVNMEEGEFTLGTFRSEQMRVLYRSRQNNRLRVMLVLVHIDITPPHTPLPVFRRIGERTVPYS